MLAKMIADEMFSEGAKNELIDENQEDKPRILSTITDKEGIEHFYNGAIHSGENWCYNHNQYETVEIR